MLFIIRSCHFDTCHDPHLTAGHSLKRSSQFPSLQNLGWLEVIMADAASLTAQIASLSAQLTQTRMDIAVNTLVISHIWRLTCGVLVFLMQVRHLPH